MRKHEVHEFSSRLLDALRGHTQDELARAVGVTQGAVSRWLAGDVKPHRKTAQKIADALGVEALWLMEGEGERLNARSKAIGEQVFRLLGVGVERAPENEIHETDNDIHNPLRIVGEEIQTIARSLAKIGDALVLLSKKPPFTPNE